MFQLLISLFNGQIGGGRESREGTGKRIRKFFMNTDGNSTALDATAMMSDRSSNRTRTRLRTLPAWMRRPQVLVLSYDTARLYMDDLTAHNHGMHTILGAR